MLMVTTMMILGSLINNHHRLLRHAGSTQNTYTKFKKNRKT